MLGARLLDASHRVDAMIWLVLRLLLEAALSCHCLTWSTTPHGARCIAPLDHPRCELIEGSHPIAFGILTCSKGCAEW